MLLPMPCIACGPLNSNSDHPLQMSDRERESVCHPLSYRANQKGLYTDRQFTRQNINFTTSMNHKAEVKQCYRSHETHTCIPEAGGVHAAFSLLYMHALQNTRWAIDTQHT